MISVRKFHNFPWLSFGKAFSELILTKCVQNKPTYTITKWDMSTVNSDIFVVKLQRLWQYLYVHKMTMHGCNARLWWAHAGSHDVSIWVNSVNILMLAHLCFNVRKIPVTIHEGVPRYRELVLNAIEASCFNEILPDRQYVKILVLSATGIRPCHKISTRNISHIQEHQYCASYFITTTQCFIFRPYLKKGWFVEPLM